MNDALERLELRIAQFLRYGVMLAGLLMGAGWITRVFLQNIPLVDFKIYQHDDLILVLKQAYDYNQYSILMSYAGLFVLISLPILRVFFTAVLFLKQKEYILSIIASFVLICLGLSFSLGIEL